VRKQRASSALKIPVVYGAKNQGEGDQRFKERPPPWLVSGIRFPFTPTPILTEVHSTGVLRVALQETIIEGVTVPGKS